MRKFRLMCKKWFLWALIFLASGCASSVSVKEDKFYPLSVNAPSPLASPFPVEAVIAVERFLSEAIYEERPIVYSMAQRPHELLQYHYYQWTEGLPSLVQTRLIDYLRKTNLTTFTVHEGYSSYPDYVISGQIKRFVYVVSGDSGRVEVALALQVQDKGKLIFLKDYQESVDITQAGVHNAAEGFGMALSKVFAAFVQDMALVVQAGKLK